MNEVNLNVGSGDKALSGHLNIDLRLLPKTDMGASITNLPFASNSADSVICSDVLEHLPRNRLLAALAEIGRVLKTGGIVKIKMPDIRALAEGYVAGKIGTADFARKIYGNQESGQDENFHRNGLDATTLKVVLENLGFVDVQVHALEGADWGNLGSRAVKGAPG